MENLEENDTFQAPQSWLDLPVNIWLQVMNDLEDEDISNIHLLSKKFHEIASNYPHQVVMRDDVVGAVQTLMNFSRICDEVEFEFFAENDSDIIYDFFVKTEVYIKQLNLKNLSWTPVVLTNVLKSVPNVQSLELNSVDLVEEMESDDDQLPIKLPKLRNLTVRNVDSADNSTGSRELMANLLDLLACAPTEVSLSRYSGLILESFLQKHKDSLKKLKLYDFEDQLLSLTGFKLEHLDLDGGAAHESPRFSISLLTEPNSLKFLKLGSNFATAENLNFIFHNLDGLEVLELVVLQGIMTAECYHQLHRFRNLKRFVVSDDSYDDKKDDLVQGLTAAVNENFVELKTECGGFSSHDLNDLSRCLPNLQKLHIAGWSWDDFRFLKCFKNLEDFTSDYVANNRQLESNRDVEPMTNLKTLHMECDFEFCKHVVQLYAHFFPALTSFSVRLVYHPSNDESTMKILESFTQLKFLQLTGSDRVEDRGESLPLLQCLKKYGRNLEWVHIYYARYDIDILKDVLKDLKGLRFSSNHFDIFI